MLRLLQDVHRPSDMLRDLSPRDPGHPRKEHEVIADRHVLVGRRKVEEDPEPFAHFVRLGAHVDSAHGRLSSGRAGEAGEDAEAGRLPCAVGPKQPEDLSLADLEGDLIQGSNPGIVLDETAGLDKHFPPDACARR